MAATVGFVLFVVFAIAIAIVIIIGLFRVRLFPFATRYIMVVQSWYSIFEVGVGATTVAISSLITIDFAAAAAAAAAVLVLITVIFIHFRK